MRNVLAIEIVGMDLTTCSNLKFYVRQNGTTYSYNGTADANDHSVMNVEIPKSDTQKFTNTYAQVQVALTDANGIPRSHEPVTIKMGDFLEVTGYGS